MSQGISAPRPCIKLTEFEYPTSKIKAKRSLRNSPITLLSYRPPQLLDQQLGMKNLPLCIDLILQKDKEEGKPKQQYKSRNYNKKKSPKSETYKPIPCVFGRFSYENYNNYSYKTSQKPSTEHFLKPPKHAQLKEKTLQIIFCENRLPEFVEHLNYRMSEQKIQAPLGKRCSPVVVDPQTSPLLRRNRPCKSESCLSKVGQPSKRTTLANYLFEFGTLEKLSQFMQKQRNLHEKCLLSTYSNPENGTVLLDILTHRFSFLKRLSPKMREAVYRALLGNDIHELTKINIHQYLTFIQVFVNRDAERKVVAALIHDICFLNKSYKFQQVEKAFRRLHGKNSTKQKVFQKIERILFEEYEKDRISKSELIYKIEKEEKLTQLFVDFVLQI